MKRTYKPIFLVVLLLSLPAVNYAQKLEKEFDKMLEAQYSSAEPGVTALVAIGGQIVYHKAFGMANLELDVKMEPGMVFQLGSITKQFTAVSILMLMERGKINLDDDITKFIKDYPTHGHHISIHHLLTHTSGLANSTTLNPWDAHVRKKELEPEALINYFKNEPMVAVPGEAYQYNNFGYIILGNIIEKVSGKTYEEFVKSNIFQPLGMQASRYASHTDLIKNRAYGYEKQSDFVNAEYISFTQTYAAGSLMSTVGDLYIWNRALRSNKLLKPESLELAFTNHTLNKGDKINYGYGWFHDDLNGSPAIEHAGVIQGFLTNAIYAPDEDVFVAVLTNCSSNDPRPVSTKMAALAIKKPYPNVQDIVKLTTEDLQKWEGYYHFEDGSSRIISLEGDQLVSHRPGSKKFKLNPISNNSFVFENGTNRIDFLETSGNIEVTFAKRIRKTKGARLIEIELDDEALESFKGKYEVVTNFDITITTEDGKLMVQGTGQDKLEIFPVSQTKFFFRTADAQIEFITDDSGRFVSFVLTQKGRIYQGKRKG